MSNFSYNDFIIEKQNFETELNKFKTTYEKYDTSTDSSFITLQNINNSSFTLIETSSNILSNILSKIEEGEIISPSVLNNDIFGGKLPKEMRFKIFKAKYRRNFTYDDIKNKSIYGTEPNNPVLGYNYPHDFYSLIEMAKVDIGLEYDGDEE